MTWDILAGLITIVGCLIALDDTMKQLRGDLDRQRDENKESHKRIYDKLDDHEHRIIELEKK